MKGQLCHTHLHCLRSSKVQVNKLARLLKWLLMHAALSVGHMTLALQFIAACRESLSEEASVADGGCLTNDTEHQCLITAKQPQKHTHKHTNIFSHPHSAWWGQDVLLQSKQWTPWSTSFSATSVGESGAAFKALFVCKQSAESRPNTLPPTVINNQQTSYRREETEGRKRVQVVFWRKDRMVGWKEGWRERFDLLASYGDTSEILTPGSENVSLYTEFICKCCLSPNMWE